MRYKELSSIRAVKKLPEVDFNAISNIPKDQAIYFILSKQPSGKNRVIYIGYSTKFRQRIQTHNIIKMLKDLGQDFSVYYWATHKLYAPVYEKDYIRCYNPKWNIANAPYSHKRCRKEKLFYKLSLINNLSKN